MSRQSDVSALLGFKIRPDDLVEEDEDDDEEEEVGLGRQTFSQSLSSTQRATVAKKQGDANAQALVNEEELQAAAEEKEKLEKIQKLNEQVQIFNGSINDPFHTVLEPEDMRCLALVAHNHMKPAMKAFIETHSEILKKFRITGTNTTMSMCRTVFGEEDESVIYGPSCTSGPLGGDAQLAALMCLEDVGGIIFFMDPLSPHPHQADIDSLVRLTNVNNVVLCPNPTTGIAFMWMIRQALIQNKPEMMPSFFQTLESPAVADYKAGQKAALQRVVADK